MKKMKEINLFFVATKLLWLCEWILCFYGASRAKKIMIYKHWLHVKSGRKKKREANSLCDHKKLWEATQARRSSPSLLTTNVDVDADAKNKKNKQKSCSVSQNKTSSRLSQDAFPFPSLSLFNDANANLATLHHKFLFTIVSLVSRAAALNAESPNHGWKGTWKSFSSARNDKLAENFHELQQKQNRSDNRRRFNADARRALKKLIMLHTNTSRRLTFMLLARVFAFHRQPSENLMLHAN